MSPMPVNDDPYEIHQIGKTHDCCIDVMLYCTHLIYIFGGRFDGKYLGSDYSQ